MPLIRDPENPSHRVITEPSPRRVRSRFGGETIADSTRVLLLHETAHLPVYYFPKNDVRMDLLKPTDRHTHCPFKGEASYWSVAAGGKTAENAVWGYEDPLETVAEIKDHLAFYWHRMDHWYEEDEEVYVHARDPYSRVDVVASQRPVRVVLGGETVAESERALFLFETGLPARYYLPREDVRMDLLERTETSSQCPYKGTAVYWSARTGGKDYEDVVWSYPEPIAEMPRIKDLLCFFNERVDDIYVDGAPVPKVKTKWSKD